MPSASKGAHRPTRQCGCLVPPAPPIDIPEYNVPPVAVYNAPEASAPPPFQHEIDEAVRHLDPQVQGSAEVVIQELLTGLRK